MLRRFLDTFGFEYEFISATDFYRSGSSTRCCCAPPNATTTSWR
jgi:lysyl-tRNA synthetase class I